MNADIMIEDINPAHYGTIQAETQKNHDDFSQQRAAWECLKFFENTPTTEADFRIRFANMVFDDVTLLKAFYNVRADAELLTMICRFWNVRV